MAGISPLRVRMIEDLTIRNLAQATQQSYVYAVAKFSRYFHCSPDRLRISRIEGSDFTPCCAPISRDRGQCGG